MGQSVLRGCISDGAAADECADRMLPEPWCGGATSAEVWILAGGAEHMVSLVTGIRRRSDKLEAKRNICWLESSKTGRAEAARAEASWSLSLSPAACQLLSAQWGLHLLMPG